ncbi:MAG: tetratricopeptide repeat protein [Chitinophagaceae bacterium]
MTFRSRSILLGICFTILFSVNSLAQGQSPEEQAAVSLLRAGKTDEALLAFNKLLQTNPNNVNARGAVAQLYLNKGDYAAAYKTATDAMKTAPDAAFLAISAATASLKLDKPEEALRLMDALIVKQPSMEDAHYLRGRALDAEAKVQQAIGAYSKAISLKPEFPDVYYNRGADFYEISRYADALKDLNKLLELDGSWSLGYNKRGMTNYALGNMDAAISDYTKTISLEPSSAIPYANRGLIYLERKQIDAAKSDFQKAISLEANYAEGHYGLARVYNEQREFAQALTEIQRAISLNEKMPAYLAVYCATLIGLNRDGEAIPVAEKILAMNPKNPDGWMYKAAAQSNMSNFAAAITTMNSAIAELPDNYLMYALRAGIYRQQGNTSAAAADDAKAKSLGTH